MEDIDGNIYVTVSIGTQVWMAENLKTTRYNNGKPIPIVTDDKAWKALETPGYCWYKNDVNHRETSGALYNWYTVNTGKLCPGGWHVPTEQEWSAMERSLGDLNIAGNKLKEAGNAHWKNYLSGATNESGFTAIPGGLRHSSGIFPLYGDSYAVWWTSTTYDEEDAWNHGLHDSSSRAFKGFDSKKNGFSVRCLKN
ncbi:MAG: fibrobacter succinogenes major paralogous domain-containing protein [Bacteroidales bacterium]|nr:fibrobacter succinogenes major paralogous domain-containing protein [Bacteroidales bacterium]